MLKIKKKIALIGIIFIFGLNLFTTFAATQIGTGSIIGTPSSDTPIIWDDNIPGTASGIINGVVVTAKVLPTLNMEISSGSIDLGTIIPGVEYSGNIDIEVGTNATNGITITAKSGSGGLTNINDNSIQINNLSTDGSVESYTFASTALATDSTIPGFVSSGDLVKTEVNNNTTEHIIYNTNKPEQLDATNADLNFTVSATANTQTIAGDYKDTITFTVTGNF